MAKKIKFDGIVVTDENEAIMSAVKMRFQLDKQMTQLQEQINALEATIEADAKERTEIAPKNGVRYQVGESFISVTATGKYTYAKGVLEELYEKNNGVFTTLFDVETKPSFKAKEGNDAIMEYARTRDNEIAKKLKTGLTHTTGTKTTVKAK